MLAYRLTVNMSPPPVFTVYELLDVVRPNCAATVEASSQATAAAAALNPRMMIEEAEVDV